VSCKLDEARRGSESKSTETQSTVARVGSAERGEEGAHLHASLVGASQRSHAVRSCDGCVCQPSKEKRAIVCRTALRVSFNRARWRENSPARPCCRCVTAERHEEGTHLRNRAAGVDVSWARVNTCAIGLRVGVRSTRWRERSPATQGCVRGIVSEGGLKRRMHASSGPNWFCITVSDEQDTGRLNQGIAETNVPVEDQYPNVPSPLLSIRLCYQNERLTWDTQLPRRVCVWRAVVESESGREETDVFVEGFARVSHTNVRQPTDGANRKR
jgi:hypothetical protein